MTESSKQKDPFIKIPTKIFLTLDGRSLFANKPNQLKRFKNRDGKIKEGLSSKKYNALLVQKMIMNSYAEEIYVKEPNLLSYRSDIIHTNNLVVYGILYKKLSPSLAEMLFNSTVVKSYNRKNPKYAIDNLNQISKGMLEKIKNLHKDLFESMEKEIYSEVHRRIINHRLISEEDKKTRIRSLDKFIAWIDKRIWYLYHIIYQTSLKKEVINSFASMIVNYLARTQIATHLSNLLMEFIQNAEKAHFHRIIVRGKYAPREIADNFIRDSENRKQIIEEAKKQEQMLELSWNMNPETISVGQQYRISITVSNYGIISDMVQENLSKKMRTNVDGISLASFYKDSGDEQLGAGIGLLYNSYLEDFCRQENIFYRCNIFPEFTKEKTTVKVEIII